MARYKYAVAVAMMVAAACVTSCAQIENARMVVPVGGLYGPTSGARIGVVEYRPTGVFRDKREQDALKKMYDACGGHYKVLLSKRGPFIPFVPPEVGDGKHVDVQAMGDRRYIYMEFQCTGAAQANEP